MAYHKPEKEKENPFINNPNLVIVPVIASFSTDGKMIPVYFSVEGIKIKIDKVICVKENLAWEAITSVKFVYVMLQSSLIIRGI